ncbi:MAG: CIA30 family protein [Chitinispirillaceae bacterium]|nr:CIA30 family protein [Chitinispirillaceae bacterium]
MKRFAGLSLTLLLSLSNAFSAAKFPFPQQYKYTNGIMPAGVSHTHVQTVYDIWLKEFYDEQGDLARIKFDNPSQTVSEGIGYGMLIMVYMDNADNNTQPKFDKLWNYWKKYPSSGSLMHWKINGFGNVAETGSATDGDIDAAHALILAASQWGDERYLSGAKAIMSAMRQGDISNNVLDGGDNWNSINPSYMSTAATQLFQEVDAGGNWSTVQSGCYSHLKNNQNGSTGMWPNWTSGGVGGCPGCYGFDAARTPWRLGWAYVWYGHADAKSCCTKIVDWFKSNTDDEPGKIGQIYNLNGSINTGAGGSSDNIPTFLGPLVVAGMVDSKFQSWVDKGYTRLRSFGGSNDKYYNECIELLTMLLLSGNMPDITKVQPKTIATLTVKVSPDSAGIVTVSPQKSSYTRGESVTITAASADTSRYAFIGWSGDYEGAAANATLNLFCDMSVTATFKDRLAQDCVDDCEDGNARTFLKTSWFTFNDSASGGKSTVTPLTTSKAGFKMTEGGYNSEYAAKISYKLDKGGFSGDPFVGIGFMMDQGSDPVDISKSTGIRFYYKGTFGDTTCGLKIECGKVTEAGANYSYYLKPNSSWKEVNITWDDFQQPKWAKQPVKLDLTVITKLQWQIQGKSGSTGELWLDEIHLIGFLIEQPIATGPRATAEGGFMDRFGCRQAGGNLFVDYSCAQSGRVDFSLYDLTGRLVRHLMRDFRDAGDHAASFDITGAELSNGNYIIRLKTAGGSSARRLAVNR